MGEGVTACSDAHLPLRRRQFSLRAVFLVTLLIATSLALGRLLHPLWGALLITYAALAYVIWGRGIRSRLRLPLILASLHTLLATVAGAIEFASAWDDMNPTMLVMLAIMAVDYPIHQAFMHAGLFPNDRTAWYPTQLVFTGALLWFTVGCALQFLVSGVRYVLRLPRDSTT
jgi:hypothetical protein